MKRITVTLSDEAEKQFNEIMYSLPKNNDGSGTCTQSQAINHALEALADLESKGIVPFIDDSEGMIFLNAAIVLQNFIWRGNKFPIEKVKIKQGSVVISQQDVLEYLMQFQQFVMDNQAKWKKVEHRKQNKED